jgi:hypothetical protein
MTRRDMITDRVWQWIAWRLPRRLVMWAAVRLIIHATAGEYSAQVVPELTAMDALRRWSSGSPLTVRKLRPPEPTP